MSTTAVEGNSSICLSDNRLVVHVPTAQLLCLILPSPEQAVLQPVQKMLIKLQLVSSLCAWKKDFLDPPPPLTDPTEGGAN